jgi:hypothetical protein
MRERAAVRGEHDEEERKRSGMREGMGGVVGSIRHPRKKYVRKQLGCPSELA